MKTCPFCAEEIQDAAIVCKHCGRDLLPTQVITAQAVVPARSRMGLIGYLGCFGSIVLAISLLGIVGSQQTHSPTVRATQNPSAVVPPPPPTLAPRVDATPPLALLASKGYESYGYRIIEGQVKNLSDAPIKSVLVVGTWYAVDGTFIGSDNALIDFNPLLPGQTSPFKTMMQGNPMMQNYSVTFKAMFGGEIPSRDDRSAR